MTPDMDFYQEEIELLLIIIINIMIGFIPLISEILI